MARKAIDEIELEFETIRRILLERNDMVLFGGVMNQAFPINRRVGGRWFDEMGWEPEVLEGGPVTIEGAA